MPWGANMVHLPYPKIPTRSDGSPGGVWVATEKIHGAHLVVATDGEVVQVGKRKAWLDPDEPFFGWQLIRGELDRLARAARAALGEPVTLYGELYGGGYPHPEVAAVPGLSPVQTGIYYAPDLRWAAFDARVGDQMIGHADLEALGLPAPPLLGQGKRGDLASLPVRYPTRVPAALGLPAIDGNVAEGFVLKPVAAMAAGERPAVKHRIAELDDSRFDQSAPFDPGSQLSVGELLRLAASVTNRARLASARSKVGESRAALIDEIALDVWYDLESALPRCVGALVGPDANTLQAGLVELATALVNSNGYDA